MLKQYNPLLFLLSSIVDNEFSANPGSETLAEREE